MSYEVRVLARARQDLDAIVAYIAERSPEGAARLVASFEDALARLETNPYTAAVAAESVDLGEEVRHFMFRTPAGRMHRALFIIVGEEVRGSACGGPGSDRSGPVNSAGDSSHGPSASQ